MRQILFLIFIFFALSSFGQHKTKATKVTILFYDNQNPGLSLTIDTLRKKVDLTATSIDLFFCHKNFDLPYYVPTDGIYRNVAKEKECNMRIYPATVKCYEYDSQNRVSRMTVSGSGTENNFTYKYNDKNQIIELKDYETDIYKLRYNADGTLAELARQSGSIEKRLVFFYN
jgi:YD repeat-containing protein